MGAAPFCLLQVGTCRGGINRYVGGPEGTNVFDDESLPIQPTEEARMLRIVHDHHVPSLIGGAGLSEERESVETAGQSASSRDGVERSSRRGIGPTDAAARRARQSCVATLRG